MLSIPKLGALVGAVSSVVMAAPAAVAPAPAATATYVPRDMIYVQTFHTTSGGNLTLLPLIQNKTGVTHIELAAVHINDDPHDIHLNDDNPNSTIYDQVWKEVAQIQKTGVKVLFMLGGAAGGDYAKLCGSNNASNPINYTYYEPLRYTIAYHGIQGIDLDIEESVSQQCPLSLLQQFDKDFGKDFILTMAPVASALSGGTGFGPIDYKQLDKQATSKTRPNGKLVNYYNGQFYNGFGDASSTDSYDQAVANGFDPSRVVLGILDSSQDGSSWYPLATYKKTIKALRAKYPTFGGVIGWEYFNAGTDSQDNLKYPWQWVKGIGQSVGSATRKLRRFLGF